VPPRKRVDLDDLVDRSGVAEILDVEPSSVTRIIYRYAQTATPTPAPVKQTGKVKYWHADDWRKWNTARARPMGRPTTRCPDAAGHGQTPCPICGRRRTGTTKEQA